MSTTYRVREKTDTIIDVALATGAGAPAEGSGLLTLVAKMTDIRTTTVIFEGRDVKAALVGGVLALELTKDDTTKLGASGIEPRAVTLTATYGSPAKTWHDEFVVEVVDLVGVS